MKKIIRTTLLVAAVSLLMLSFFTGCKQKVSTDTKKNVVSEIKVTAFSIDGKSALDQKSLTISNGDFQITADSDISSLSVICAGQAPAVYPAGSKTVKGTMPKIDGKEKAVQFVLHSEGKKDKIISINLSRFTFTKISAGKTELDLSLTDDSFIFETAQDEVVLNIECSSTDTLDVKVKAGNAAESSAVKYGDSYAFKLSGITQALTAVKITAANNKKQTVSYSFKVKKEDISLQEFHIDGTDAVSKIDSKDEEVSVTAGEFILKAESAIESLDIDVAGKKKTYKAAENMVKGMIENLQEGSNIALFTVKAAGNKTRTFALTLFVTPIKFNQIVDIDLTKNDGSYVKVVPASSFKLDNIRVNTEVTAIKVKAGNAAEVEAVKQVDFLGMYFHFAFINNITEKPMTVTVTAEGSFNRKAVYTFKIRLRNNDDIDLDAFMLGTENIRDGEGIKEKVETTANDFTVETSCELDSVEAVVNNGKPKKYAALGRIAAGTLEGIKDGENKVKFTLTSKSKKTKTLETTIIVKAIKFTRIASTDKGAKQITATVDLSKQDGSYLLTAGAKSISLQIDTDFPIHELIVVRGATSYTYQFHSPEKSCSTTIGDISSKPEKITLIAVATGNQRKNAEYSFMLNKKATIDIESFRLFGNSVSGTNIHKISSSSFESAEKYKTKHFSVKASGKLKSAEVTVNGKSKTYPASGKIVEGDFEFGNLIEGKQPVQIKLTAEDGKTTHVISFILDFTKEALTFENIGVVEKNALSEEAEIVDLEKKDGSELITLESDTVKVFVETNISCTVKVKKDNDAEKEAASIWGPKSTELNGISGKPSVIIVKAESKYRKPAEHKFKIKKGTVPAKVLSIKVNRQSVDIESALSSGGCDVNFDRPVYLGEAAIEVNVKGDKIKKVTPSSTAGLVKDALLLNEKRFSHTALCFAAASIDESGNVVYEDSVTNSVTFKIEFEKSKPITLKLNITDTTQEMPSPYYAVVKGANDSYYSPFTRKVNCKNTTASLTFRGYQGEAKIFAPLSVNGEWQRYYVPNGNEVVVEAGTFDEVPSEKTFYLIFAAADKTAVKVPFKCATTN